MNPTLLARPREIRASKPVRVVLVGGFLGAGKTTALVALARQFQSQGRTVAIVTNDQAANLVDTAIVRNDAIPAAEVAGGCFCCRFTDLLDAFESVLTQEPDIILCEPVGSCTDMAATVLNPLRLFYRDVFSLSPFTVLVDPTRARQTLLKEGGEPFAPEVGYIFEKQLEESDLIAVNKTDTLSIEEIEQLQSALSERFKKPVLALSAAQGDGIAEWAQQLQLGGAVGTNILAELDYDRYAKGEAVLGWLNATVALNSAEPFDAADFLLSLVANIQNRCARAEAEIAHLKASISSGSILIRVHATRTDEVPTLVSPTADFPISEGTLTLNIRAEIEPGRLGGIAISAIEDAGLGQGVDTEVTTLQSFSPGYPRPPYRIAELVTV